MEKLAAASAISVTVEFMETSESTAPIRYAGRHRIVDHAAPSLPGYDVVEPIGQGGSGTVWSATSPDGDVVAVKVVPAVDVDDALVELAVLGRVRDPHLVRLHEAVALPSGEVALVLDHLAGGTVGGVVRARGHLGAGELVTVLSPVASTLARLHGLGVVHGDLSPDNVLLDLDGRPFVADLGIARIMGEAAVGVRGTEGFVAPEVLAGALPSPASDVHALGALAWFCLTGAAPGPGVVRGRLGELVPGLPDALVEIVEGALRTRAEDRPDADAVAVAVFDSAEPQPLVLSGEGDDPGLLTRRIRAAARPASMGGSSAVAAAAGAARRRPGWLGAGRALLPWATVLTAVAALVLGVLWWSGGHDDARATPGEVSSPAGATASTVSSVTDPRLLADAPRRDPVALVQSLADARADAWATGTAARLVEVDAPRSPALARDTEVLAEVQRAGQRYVGLTFVVRDATVVAGAGSAADDASGVVTIRARIDTGAHVVRGPGGDVGRPAATAAPVLLDVVRTSSGWRVRDVRPA